MKLVIDIPKGIYNILCQNNSPTDIIRQAVIEGTPQTESDDCVSREAVLQYIKRSIHDLDYDSEMAYKDVENMSSVQPKSIRKLSYDEQINAITSVLKSEIKDIKNKKECEKNDKRRSN